MQYPGWRGVPMNETESLDSTQLAGNISEAVETIPKDEGLFGVFNDLLTSWGFGADISF